ncbi:MAG: hypothetical protein LBU88_00535 [Treponema sp.]|jgi:hypothetical protein|nr:hypothetical protein [Treponema sp.]
MKNKHRTEGLQTIKFFLFIALFLFFNSYFSNLSASEFSLRLKGFASMPMGSGSITPNEKSMYNMGGGGEIGFEIDLFSAWPNPIGLSFIFGVEGGMLDNPFQGNNIMNVNFYSFGGTLGLYLFPLSRFFTRIDGAIGVYQSAVRSGINESSQSSILSQPGLFWRGGGEIGFRFTPGFLIAANAGWRQYEEGWGLSFINSNTRSMNSGYYAGLTAQITFQTGKRSNEGIHVILDQPSAVYPAFMQIYQSTAIGTAVVRNNEDAEIRNVRLYFRADPYTTSEFPCGTVSIIPRGRSVQLPLLADFSSEILRFTDDGRIMGEVVVRYRFLGQEREAVRAVTVATHNRNKIISSDAQPLDPAAYAAFISPTSPETLNFARFIAGLSRAHQVIGHNKNMLYAIWLLEGLRASNISLGETYTDKTHVQFPAETLLFRTGSSRDLALLFASCLEGVGIPSAFIQTEDDFLVAINLGIGQAAAETLFNGIERILIINDRVWLPLSMSAFNDGFIAAWTQGTAVLNETFTAGKDAEFVIVESAWAAFPPAPLPEMDRGVIRTDTEAAVNQVNRAVRMYIAQELNPMAQEMRRQMNTNSTASLYNRLGIVLIRSGHNKLGKDSYEIAAAMGSVPAMTNRGNLALIERDFAAAERWFRQALQNDNQNKAAIRGLERVISIR